MVERSVADMMGREIIVPARPLRIISLVPSQTELLHSLGVGDRVFGITKFCVHPQEWFRSKERVGGTKNVNFERIKELKPDLIIANKEENDKAQIETLVCDYPVWISDIKDLAGALTMIRQVGALVNEEEKAVAIANDIADKFANLPKPINPLRAAYFIWRDPWMCAGGDTFISNMIEHMGWVNVLKDIPRYPSIELEQLIALRPEIVLLSSEPYPFKTKHIAEIKKVLPLAEVRLVDGEMFSWYGSRLLEAVRYFSELFKECDGSFKL
jgi:ABC-type Fe3+-hydroxamate transport system substrate-binding protein